ncbi:hypothetical protein FRC16_002453 [Serendipita sp. 398]|nr:hypothetical protein FRC16_002453 [Serendipita sp. 398]
MSIRSPPTPNASTRPTSNINNILNPTSVFDRDARRFLSSRACERQTDVVDDRDQQDHDYHRARSPVSVASSNGSRGNYESDRYSSSRHRSSAGVPLPSRGEHDHYSTQRQYAAEIGRSSTAVPVGNPSSIYPSAMLPSSRSSRPPGHSRESSSDYQRSMAHYSQPRPPSSMSGITISSASSATSSMSSTFSNSSQDPDSPVYTSPRQSGYRTTNGHSGNGYPNYNEYARGTTNGGSRHSHSQSYSTNAYATDHQPSRLVPSRHSTGGSMGGRGGVGPAVAANLPPVLPRPPNTSGSSSSTMKSGRRTAIGRSSLSMSMSARSGRVDDDDMVAQAVNTYRQSGPIVDI